MQKVNSDYKKDGIFNMVYTGHLYGGRRDLSPIFAAIRELVDDNMWIWIVYVLIMQV